MLVPTCKALMNHAAIRMWLEEEEKRGNQISWGSAQISRMAILTSISLSYIQQPSKTNRWASVDHFKTTLYKMCISRHDQSLIKTTTQAYCTFICLMVYNWNVYSGDIDLYNISSMHHDNSNDKIWQHKSRKYRYVLVISLLINSITSLGPQSAPMYFREGHRIRTVLK